MKSTKSHILCMKQKKLLKNMQQYNKFNIHKTEWILYL